MARSVQERVAARGFPVFDISGQSGQGALPDSTLPSGQLTGQPTAAWTDPNVDLASVPATIPPPEEYVLGQVLWGLPGAAKPDDTPRTHAAPIADPTLAWQDGARKNSAGIEAYNAELEAAHGPVFDGVSIRRHPGTLPQFPFRQDTAQGSPAGPLQPLTGQIRAMGGYDAVQGYGGGGDGPGGTNAHMPLTVNDLEFPGHTYTNVFLNAAEKPFSVAIADQFIATAPELPVFTGVYDAPTTSVLAQDTVASDTPATGPAVSQSSGLLPAWGSLG